MKRFFKALSLSLLALCIAVYSAVIYGTQTLPDELNITETDEIDFGSLYSAEEGEQVRAAGTMDSKTEYKSKITQLLVSKLTQLCYFRFLPGLNAPACFQ